MTPPHTPSWHTLAVYSGHPNRVVLDVIRAWEQDLGSVCESYWTRGYVGGAHVRVNVRADAGTASSVLERLADMAADHFETMPTTDDGGYDPERARRLSVEEGLDTAGIDFGYRADVTAAVPYHTPASHLGVEGATLTEAFYAESRPTAYAILDATSPRAEALKLYFLRSLVFLGSLVDGSLSFRSHWERFAAGKPATLTASIEAAYAANREGIHAVAEAALAEWEHGDLSQDPVVAAWVPLQRRFQDRIAALYDAGRLGAVVPSEPRTYLEHGRLSMGGAERETPFLSVLFGDDDAFDRFCGRRGLVLTRMNVNLLYLLLPQLGFSVVDRFAFGHFAYRAVEDLYDVDLADRLRGVMARGA